MILVTGATGNFGGAAIDFLIAKGTEPSQITALVRDVEKAENLKNKGIHLVTGSYDDYASLVAAFKGVDKLLFVSSSDISKRTSQQENVVKAAKEAGVKHVVYTSFGRKNETETSPIAFVAEAHLKTEQWLKESGLTHTILRNNLYMDFFPVFIGEKVLETGVVYLPAENGRASIALRSEMAEAAVNVLLGEGHENKEYELANIESYTYGDAAKYIGEVTGKNINYVSPSADEYVATLQGFGVPAEYVGMFTGFAVAQAQGEFESANTDLETLLGRKPTTLKAYFATVYSAN